MRNPERISKFISKLAVYWEKYCPDWRFGQLMSNFFRFVDNETNIDIFYIEDDKMSEWLDKYFGHLFKLK